MSFRTLKVLNVVPCRVHSSSRVLLILLHYSFSRKHAGLLLPQMYPIIFHGKINGKKFVTIKPGELARCTYTRSTDPLPDFFESASLEDDFAPTFTAKLTSIRDNST